MKAMTRRAAPRRSGEGGAALAQGEGEGDNEEEREHLIGAATTANHL